MQKKTWNTLGIIALFCVGMAFLESVIVFYLRKLYYPEGFAFPLRGFIEPQIYQVEVVREFFTIVILICVAILAGKKFYDRFAYFWYAFAVWDIFYYIWLKVTLDWPASLFTWDVLFLIPWAWAGPVLAPVISSVTMIALCFSILYLQDKGYAFKITVREWLMLILGGLLQLFTFLYDYGRLVLEGKLSEVASFTPVYYNWLIFILGEILIIIAIASWHSRTLASKKR
jgi:hypothetical protein